MLPRESHVYKGPPMTVNGTCKFQHTLIISYFCIYFLVISGIKSLDQHNKTGLDMAIYYICFSTDYEVLSLEIASNLSISLLEWQVGVTPMFK